MFKMFVWRTWFDLPPVVVVVVVVVVVHSHFLLEVDSPAEF